MSGDEHGKRGKASKGKVLVDGLERSELRPRLLVPTPAQLERGERLIDADPDTWPDAVRQMVKRAEKAGWSVRVTYSHFMDVPPAGGHDKGQWVDTHSMAVRMAHSFAGRAWGCWWGRARTGWKFDSAQFWGPFMGCAASVNATELNGLVTGTMTMKVEEGTGAYRVESVAKLAAAQP